MKSPELHRLAATLERLAEELRGDPERVGKFATVSAAAREVRALLMEARREPRRAPTWAEKWRERRRVAGRFA